ncbi:MAG TPA: TMEM175 family protein [Ktedonobacterales bacterium]|jgi:uncharacterized membrane protein
MQAGPENIPERTQSQGVATRRLEAFSDAVFAIAITLLALNLQVPVLPTITPQALVAALGEKWPTYLSLVLSFLTLLIAWVYHHRLLQGVRRAGTGILFTNGALLLVVSAVPFPTALLGTYLTTPAASVVAAIYAGYIGLLNLTYNILWGVVERQQPGYTGMLKYTYNLLWRIVVKQQRKNHLQGWRPPTSMILSYLGFPCYLVAAVIAFWSPVATLVICGTLWVVWTIMAPMLSAEQ